MENKNIDKTITEQITNVFEISSDSLKFIIILPSIYFQLSLQNVEHLYLVFCTWYSHISLLLVGSIKIQLLVFGTALDTENTL